ncbi:MAG: dihydropteroate synthase-like protein, partial [Archaeoglobaceae archaeon]|nr:dihydropteroate synthase-like protein [Archaeoglobaceae archaeon]
MKILLITGKLAERDVRKYGKNADVYVVDIDVAAFITPSHLKNIKFNGYDLVLVPGLTKDCDWESFERQRGVKIRLGPIHAYDLKTVLDNVENIEFSHEIPACRLLNFVKAKETIEMVDKIKDCRFKIGDVKIGGRMKVVAEIVNAIMPKDDLIQRIEYYKKSGADIIDLGIPLEFDVGELKKAVKVAVDQCNALSIDTFNPKAIEIGINSGVDMVMSISYKNLKALDYIKNVAVVVVE